MILSNTWASTTENLFVGTFSLYQISKSVRFETFETFERADRFGHFIISTNKINT